MKPTNGHGEVHMHDVDIALAVVHETAAISKDAIVGTPAEWRNRATRFPAHIAENVTIREFATVHAGCDRPTSIGARTLLMTKSHVGHDTHVGEDCDIAPSATIGGCCTIGDRVKIGMNASIRPHRTIGDGARIGANAYVNCDIPAGQTWAGVPARRIR